LALAGEGDAAAAQMTLATNARTMRCMSLFSINSRSTTQKVAKTCVSTTFERTHVCRWIMTAIWAKQARKSTANGAEAEAEKAIRKG
jgi:hypothetical protein